jgi:protein O-GlcNAc transferase
MTRVAKAASAVVPILNAAMAARARGDGATAAREIARARRIDPEHADVLHVAAILAHDSGRHADALRMMRRSVARRPADPQLHRSLGLIARAADARDEAIAALRVSLAARPADPEAARLLSALLADGNAFEEALAALHALPATLRDMDWDYDAALLLALTDRHEEAARILSRLRFARPKDVRLLAGLAQSLAALGRQGEAAAVFSDALALEASPADGALLAKAYAAFKASSGDDDAAERFYSTAVMLEPDVPEHRVALIRFASGRERFMALRTWHSLRLLDIAPDREDVWNLVCANSMVPVYADASGERASIACARLGRAMAGTAPESAAPIHANGPEPGRRLRVAYVSADFREHAVAKFSFPLIAAHDRSAFEILGYADGEIVDALTEGFARNLDRLTPIGQMSDRDVAQRIREDGVDILVDLMGLTAKSRPGLFVQRPAPVQITYLGYPATTGLTCFDARICDTATDPPGLADKLFVEPLIRLDRLFLSYAPFRTAPDPEPEPPFLRKGFLTFGSFNNPAKMTRATVALWAAAIGAVPGSRLVVRNYAFENDTAVAADLRRMFAQAGIPATRIDILPKAASEEEFLTSHRDVDIALDTFPYSGTTTTCDALWMGVPVVTRAGPAHASRVSRAILLAVGLPELAADSDAAFVAACARLARDPALLRGLRHELRGRVQSSPLGDRVGLARSIERVFRQLWRNWCSRKGTPAASSETVAAARADAFPGPQGGL